MAEMLVNSTFQFCIFMELIKVMQYLLLRSQLNPLSWSSVYTEDKGN